VPTAPQYFGRGHAQFLVNTITDIAKLFNDNPTKRETLHIALILVSSFIVFSYTRLMLDGTSIVYFDTHITHLYIQFYT